MKLFNWTKIITVSDNKKRKLIQEVFAGQNIKYKMKAKEISQKNAFDTAITGTMGNNKIKINYTFYVEKENYDIGKNLINSINL